jgi:hypothetical protein
MSRLVRLRRPPFPTPANARSAVGWALVAAHCLGACGFDDRNRCQPPGPPEIDPAAAHYQYVVDSIDMPDSATDSQRLGLDLDGDPQGRPDNAIGQVLSHAFNLAGEDLDEQVRLRIEAGEIIHLFDVQATSLAEAHLVGLTAFLGADSDGDPSDNFTGDEVFEVESAGDLMGGAIADGVLHAQRGTARLAITLPALEEAFVLDLVSAQVEAEITETGMSGRLGGGVSEEDVDRVLLPMGQLGLERLIERDCDAGGCATDSAGEIALELFDEDLDGRISLDELRENSLIGSLLALDVDLFDQHGNPVPRCDGEKDCLSLGVGFTAVRAQSAAAGYSIR